MRHLGGNTNFAKLIDFFWVTKLTNADSVILSLNNLLNEYYRWKKLKTTLRRSSYLL